jgi:ribonuclease HI
LVGLTAILREAWTTSQQAEDKREKIQALSLAKECYTTKLDLLTNSTILNDAMKFVTRHQNQQQQSQNCKDDNGKDDDMKKQKQKVTENFPGAISENPDEEESEESNSDSDVEVEEEIEATTTTTTTTTTTSSKESPEVDNDEPEEETTTVTSEDQIF